MKGTVVSTWINTLNEIYGEDLVNQAKADSSWNEELIITSLMDIEDKKVFDLINTVANLVDKSPGELWQEIGRHNIKSFSKWFPSYFEGRTLKNFLMMMDTVHKQLTQMIPGANPPRIIAEQTGDRTLEITYISPRGMYDYFLGLIEGSSEFFSDPIEVTELGRGESEQGKYLKVNIEFSHSLSDKYNYRISKLFSLGIFKSIKLKATIMVMLASLGVYYGLSFTSGNWWSPLLQTACLGLITFVFMGFFTSPFKKLNKALVSLRGLKFGETLSISTNDEFERIFKQLDGIKNEIKEDILFLKGGTDDMYNFTNQFVEIADKMNVVSDNISKVVEEVANGAQEQAAETENSAYIVDNNIKKIEELVESGNDSKKNLEEAVENIKQSAREVQNVNEMIDSVKNAFSNVNSLGKKLAQRISDIMEIVNTVSDIANQTNLLSLNASIEAARSNDNSRGFAVVAEEIRELAEDSKQAGNTINENLAQFTEQVQELIDGISSQFANLEHSNKVLSEVASSNKKSSENIQEATDNVVSIVENLDTETKKIIKVIENINSLAAIAQENSASSEEMSASVNEYSEKIKEMTSYINQMEKLVENFKENLKKYNI
ncbi:heme NO-binding domain-containing protein [Halothermothrix orenii]|uniref:Methyl-accepting chemotaxis sensory transducer n=1 Tax=Halothermothrix orenii (strain H 168 / OCM 544 / DSM 9562) TaxID=373903 RepID=B8D0K8_HALOH|nr:heme NO-binding domain-containing protein [Halothermothrix orenii]ACL70944.1 methyl-accepting chemotaxis sensory transducer [Halothermothrix orenii H 168]